MQKDDSSAGDSSFRVRKLEISDKSKGFIDLLQQLSVCNSVSDKEFEDRFQDLKSYGDDHLICVIEDDRSGKIVATGSVFVEKKFLRNCGKVGHIEDVVVDASARGKQLGKKIIQFLTDHARAMGCYKPYFIAETTMPGTTGFDFGGSSQSFNVLAEYLFGKNVKSEKMEMTTPVITRKAQSVGEKMDMTTPVITKKLKEQDQWQMSFVLPSKYGSNLPLPKDPSVKIAEVPRKIVAVVAFSGFVTDEEVKRREFQLRDALKNDTQFQVKDDASVEVAQYNPPFTLPFTRRNEIALEVTEKGE